MSIELKIPDVGESVREVQIGRWLKREGDLVAQDENLVELETDKASMELPAPSAGVMGKILKREGDVVAVGDVIGYLEKDGKSRREKSESTHREATGKIDSQDDGAKAVAAKGVPKSTRAGEKQELAKPVKVPADLEVPAKERPVERAGELPITPAARRALREHGLTAADIDAKGPRLRRKDVLQYVEERKGKKPVAEKIERQPAEGESNEEVESADGELEEIVPMSLIRRRIGERLVQAQQQAALLTTFNEIDMTAVKHLRAEYRELFEQKYGVKLGLMPFFVKAVVDALKEHAGLNAEVRGGEIVYRRYYHIGIAVGSGKGLVVPVLRFAERLSFAEIEQTINDFVRRAGENKLEPTDLAGGTFTITNGGIYGSLLSTPIVNPPQSGVLGMHAIQDRPVARDGQVVIRPMMYVALTYDHRIVDGRDAVTFLKRVKETIEDPSRMLLEV